MEGPPGSKIRAKSIKGGLGSTDILVLESTVLNLPQEEIDDMLADCRVKGADMDKLWNLKMDDYAKSPEQRKFMRINDLQAARTANFQMMQMLAGYSTRSISAEVSGTLEGLKQLEGQMHKADEVLSVLDAEIERQKAMQRALPAPGSPIIDLPPGAVKVDAEPEWDETLAREPVKQTMWTKRKMDKARLEALRVMGYLTALDAWTGKMLGPEAPDWAWDMLGQKKPEEAASGS